MRIAPSPASGLWLGWPAPCGEASAVRARRSSLGSAATLAVGPQRLNRFSQQPWKLANIVRDCVVRLIDEAIQLRLGSLEGLGEPRHSLGVAFRRHRECGLPEGVANRLRPFDL